jgi:hypothetical protein
MMPKLIVVSTQAISVPLPGDPVMGDQGQVDADVDGHRRDPVQQAPAGPAGRGQHHVDLAAAGRDEHCQAEDHHDGRPGTVGVPEDHQHGRPVHHGEQIERPGQQDQPAGRDLVDRVGTAPVADREQVRELRLRGHAQRGIAELADHEEPGRRGVDGRLHRPAQDPDQDDVEPLDDHLRQGGQRARRVEAPEAGQARTGPAVGRDLSQLRSLGFGYRGQPVRPLPDPVEPHPREHAGRHVRQRPQRREQRGAAG